MKSSNLKPGPEGLPFRETLTGGTRRLVGMNTGGCGKAVGDTVPASPFFTNHMRVSAQAARRTAAAYFPQPRATHVSMGCVTGSAIADQREGLGMTCLENSHLQVSIFNSPAPAIPYPTSRIPLQGAGGLAESGLHSHASAAPAPLPRASRVAASLTRLTWRRAAPCFALPRSGTCECSGRADSGRTDSERTAP